MTTPPQEDFWTKYMNGDYEFYIRILNLFRRKKRKKRKKKNFSWGRIIILVLILYTITLVISMQYNP